MSATSSAAPQRGQKIDKIRRDIVAAGSILQTERSVTKDIFNALDRQFPLELLDPETTEINSVILAAGRLHGVNLPLLNKHIYDTAVVPLIGQITDLLVDKIQYDEEQVAKGYEIFKTAHASARGPKHANIYKNVARRTCARYGVKDAAEGLPSVREIKMGCHKSFWRFFSNGMNEVLKGDQDLYWQELLNPVQPNPFTADGDALAPASAVKKYVRAVTTIMHFDAETTLEAMESHPIETVTKKRRDWIAAVKAGHRSPFNPS